MGRENQISIGVAILLAFIFFFSGSFIRIIPAGHVGVVFNLIGGVEKRVLSEGINFVIPVLESVTVYDGRKTAFHFTDNSNEYGGVGESIKCQTNDGQKVAIDVTVITHLDKNKVWKLHQELGKNYVERLIVPQTRSSFRNTVAKYPIDTVYNTGRRGLSRDANLHLSRDFAKNGVILDEILIRSVQFSEAFAEAVERKQIALQESLRQQWIRKTAEREKERRIIEGEGEAKALDVRGRAIKLDPKIAELEFLDQLEQSGKDFTVITGTMNAIISIGDLLKSSGTETLMTD